MATLSVLEIDPADTMLPKIIAGIMDDRDPKRGGRWISTHANAWALVAASRYFETVEKDEPDYTAQVWLDELFAGEHAFKGRSMTEVEQTISMETLQGAPSRELTLAKNGVGKLYYRMGLRYAPKDLKLAATDQGFTVYRQYEALLATEAVTVVFEPGGIRRLAEIADGNAGRGAERRRPAVPQRGYPPRVRRRARAVSCRSTPRLRRRCAAPPRRCRARPGATRRPRRSCARGTRARPRRPCARA